MALIGALNAGISGLRAQETRISVIGDNIANVDTVGFKQSRVNFETMLSQALSFGTAPQGALGGVDPLQIGKGVNVASIDRNFSRGSVEATGVASDLAIEDTGDLASSFFILNDEQGAPVYSRDGAFTISSENLLHNPANGFIVQGYMADFQTFTITEGGSLQNVMIPVGDLSIARQTTQAFFTGNLNGGGQVASSGSVLESQTLYDGTGTEATPDTLLTDLQTDPGAGPVPVGLEVGDQIVITCRKGDSDAELPVATFTIGDPPPTGGTTLADLLNFIGGKLGINSDPANQTYGAERMNATIPTPTPVNGTINLVADGGTYSVMADSLTNTAVDFEAMGVQVGDFIRFLSGDSAGQIMQISGVSGDTLTFADNLDVLPATGDTFAVNEAAEVSLGGTDAGLDPASGAGKIRISGNAGDLNRLGDLLIKCNNRPLMTFTKLADAAGEAARTHATVYDSLGKAHSVSFTFVLQAATDTGNTFRYFAESDDNWGASRCVGSGMVQFNTQGQFVSATPDHVSVDLTGTGADPVFVFTPDFSGVAGLSREEDVGVAMTDQDGLEAGTLMDYNINANGVITGVFDNGQQRTLAQIMLARFANPNGLVAAGGNVFRVGVNSGQPIPGTPGTFGRGSIQSGYLEESNVDLAQQFTELIVGQRAFQANARTITTSDALLQELVNLIR
jgi:flagellar hook protein FlgE